MMKLRFVFAAVLSLLAIHSFAANGTMKGEGSAEKPFQIEDYEDLKAIGKGAYLYSSNYVLTADIDASASEHEMCSDEGGCNGFIPIGKYKDAADSTAFWGTIDGQNHTISNLKIWMPCRSDVGFIVYLVGTVRNLNFDRLVVTGGVKESRHVGSVTPRLIGSIENVHVTNGFVQGEERVGGIVGGALKAIGYGNVKGSVYNVSFQGEIKGKTCVGGIVGESGISVNEAVANVDIIATNAYIGGIVGYNSGYVTNSRASGTITPAYEEVDDVGGIAGYSGRWATISRCVSEMDLLNVTRSSMICHLDEGVGGIVGTNHGSVSESYAKGTIEGTEDVGGIAGVSYGSIQNTFALGSVKGVESVGGLVGGNAYHAYDDSHGSILNSYAANVVKGELDVGGLVGFNSEMVESSYWNTEISGLDTSAGGTGLTTAKMMKFSSFAGWDTLGYDGYFPVYLDTCDYYSLFRYCFHVTGSYVNIWKIDEGKSFPYLGIISTVPASTVPVAVPTFASKWQEQPKVAAMVDIGEELFGKWLDLAQVNETKDSIYYWYRIGYAVGSDTVWGTSSYMAVPNKIEISTYAQLKKIGRDVAYPLMANYELTADIDASSSKFEPIGDSIRAFTGMFDGKNHTIRNLEIDEPDRDFTGLFGYVEDAIIENLTLENAKVTGSWMVGALAGEIRTSIVLHVVSLNGDVQGEESVGGLIGSCIADSIRFVGTTGKVKGREEVGGLIGYMDGRFRLSDAFSVNVVKGYEDVGGAIGYNYEFGSQEGSRSILRIYSASMIKAPENEREGLSGHDYYMLDEGTCFFDSTVAHARRGGLPTATMLKKSTYAGYDFDSVWEIQEGVSYPYFKGMAPILPGTLIDDGTVNVLAGAGTERSPYKIGSYDELKYIGKYEYGLDKYYKLVGNINAQSSFKENCNADSSLCKGFEPIGEFSGVFIGNNKVIAGLNINRPDEDSVGLFRVLASGAKVTGIVFDTASYFGENYSLSYSHDKGFIRGKNYVGALAGVDKGGEVERIFMKYDVSGENYVGGIVGKKTAGSISLSASRFKVLGEEYVGGLAGLLYKADVTDCYSIANVVGTKYVGGLAGYSDNANVKNSFAAGNIEGGSKWGGLAGADNKSMYASAYYDSSLWCVNTTAAGELRSKKKKKKKENYKGWDFDTTWNIAADTTYPYLAWLTKAYYLSKTMKEKIYPNLNVDQTMLKMVGSGTEQDPFLIKTYGDLKSIGFGKYKLSSVYRLANDIDASVSKTDSLFSGRGIGFKPIGKKENLEEYCNCYGVVLGGYSSQDSSRLFTGKIYGGGYSIDGLFMSYYDSEPKGFIDTIAKTGVVDSLTFKNYNIIANGGSEYLGALASVNMGLVSHIDMDVSLGNYYKGAGLVYDNKGRIESCSVKGTFDGGGIAGVSVMNDGDIVNTKVDAEWIDSSSFASGITLVNRGLIENVSANVSIYGGSGPIAGIATLNTGKGQIVDASANIDAKVVRRNGVVSYSVEHKIMDYEYEYYDVDGIGGLVAIDSGIIRNSTASGVIDAPQSAYVGGLVGKAYGGELKGLHASVDITGMSAIGGLVGLNQTSISESYATGNVKGVSAYGSSGAFVGQNDGRIDRSFAIGDVESGSGFVGMNNGVIKQSYSTGDVEGRGSFAGINQSVIEDCYSTGDVYLRDDAYGFGFVVVNGNDALVRGYASGNVKNGMLLCGGLPSISQPSDEFYYLADNCIDSLSKGVGLTSSQMTQKKSFSAFDFDSVWYMKEGVTYPLLRGMPNPPMVADEKAVYKDNVGLTKDIHVRLLEDAFVMDTTATKVLALDYASEALLDSLEKAKSPFGKFEVSYRVGILLDSDTLWSRPATMRLELEKTIGIPEIASAHGRGFGAAFRGPHVALRFEIPAAGAVKFSLMDLQGRVVYAMDLGNRAVGAYFETLAAAGISRGRYVGVLQVDGRVTDKVLMLRK